MEKKHSELFLYHHAISLLSELHNNNLYYPIFVFTKCCWSVNS